MRKSVWLLVALFGCGGGDPEAGAAVYDATCATCHGADGKLGDDSTGEAAADLTVAVPSLSDDQLRTVITEGTGAMPAQDLSDEEVDDVIAYVRETFGE